MESEKFCETTGFTYKTYYRVVKKPAINCGNVE